MKKVFAAIAAMAVVAGCASTPASPVKDGKLITQAEKDIRDNLRDPASGQFRSPQAYHLDNGEKSVCFAVNSRNGFGGYTGFQPMIIVYTRQGGYLVFQGGPAAQECAGLSRGMSMRM